MRNVALILITCAAGCEPVDLSLDDHGPSASVYDDGERLLITGCSDTVFLGCDRPGFGVTMTATVDGEQLDIPVDGKVAPLPDLLLGIFRDGPFRRDATSPTDRTITLTIGEATADLPLTPAFAITAPPDHVSRATPLAIDFEVLDNGNTVALVESECTEGRSVDLYEELRPGHIEIDLTRSGRVTTGACTHAVHVDQTVSPVSGLASSSTRIQILSITSEP